jgi:WD40 repeat protein
MLSGGRDAMLRVWDAKKLTLLKEIPAHNYAIYSISFSPDKKLFATGSRDKTLKIWKASDHSFLFRADKEKSDAHTHSVNKTLWTKFHDILISGGDDRKVMAWVVSLNIEN